MDPDHRPDVTQARMRSVDNRGRGQHHRKDARAERDARPGNSLVSGRSASHGARKAMHTSSRPSVPEHTQRGRERLATTGGVREQPNWAVAARKADSVDDGGGMSLAVPYSAAVNSWGS